MALNTLRNINENIQSMLKEVQEIRDKITTILDVFNSDDRSQVQQFLDHLASFSRVLTNVNSLLMATPSQRPKEDEEDEEGITKRIFDLDLFTVDLTEDNNNGAESVSGLEEYEAGVSQSSEVDNEGDLVINEASLTL
ncbi:uncharacterized protein RHIMIDRAFT_291067 [Rhizopus microsporus ATCC 52813]|uniref:Uncharacterized protein n=1 Tax=Rhizopus microsporus ATCC 52813 TaxID=1340429 RepID=A0A2G4SX33_RHIZD|nr:uncharacterized protein RHIMIDRAFT_291067 [Rhizopus microsporus ATCC 52813]PHZ13304.1 hypothetical protein RHIMIDRAFT_291067 [Rhizopus microsporus ATCC 52813]